MKSRVTRLITCCLLGSGVVFGQDAAALLQRMQAALGGPRLFQVRDIDWEVKAKVWDGADAREKRLRHFPTVARVHCRRLPISVLLTPSTD